MKTLYITALTSLALCLGVLPTTVAAQGVPSDYPNKPIRILLPYSPGGQPDLVTRIVAQGLSTRLGQAVVVENLPGGAGLNAIQTLLRAPADGYTLMNADASHWAIRPAMSRKLPYDPLRDFAPVRFVAATTLLIVVPSSLQVNTVKEFVALVKSRPNTYFYGSSGIGSVQHLVAEAFLKGAGLAMQHVPYKGSAEALPALVGGQTALTVTAFASVDGFVKQGRVNILASMSRERSPLTPDVPTVAETVIPGFDYPTGSGIISRSGTPLALREKIASEINNAVTMPDSIARFKATGATILPVSTPEFFERLIRNDVPNYRRLANDAGIVGD